MGWSSRFLFVVAMAAVPALAQQPDHREAVERQAQRMRERLEEGQRELRSHVRVQVRLKNGNRLLGVVKDSHIIQRADGYRFVKTDARDPGAGIRLWYYNNSNSFIFLPFDSLQDYQVKERLSTAQVLAIETQITEEQRRKEAEQKAEQEAQRLREIAGEGEPPSGEETPAGETPPVEPQGETGKPAPKEAGGAGEAGGKETPAEAAQKEEARLLQLLRDYPPADGWSEQRKGEISRRFAVTGSRPTAHEQRFVEVFADWQKAVARFVGTGGNGNGESGGTGTGTGRRGRGR